MSLCGGNLFRGWIPSEPIRILLGVFDELERLTNENIVNLENKIILQIAIDDYKARHKISD